MFLRRLKDVTKKTSFFDMYLRRHKEVISFEMFLRGVWDVSLIGDLIEISQRHLMPAGRTPPVAASAYGNLIADTVVYDILDKITLKKTWKHLLIFRYEVLVSTYYYAYCHFRFSDTCWKTLVLKIFVKVSRIYLSRNRFQVDLKSTILLKRNSIMNYLKQQSLLAFNGSFNYLLGCFGVLIL